MPVMDGLEATKAIRMLEREDAKKDSNHCHDGKCF